MRPFPTAGRPAHRGAVSPVATLVAPLLASLLLAPPASLAAQRAGPSAGSGPSATTIAPPATSAAVSNSLFGSLAWRNLGPNRGGRSISVTGTVARPLEYYFGATGGGVWKTTDAGVTWNPIGDGQFATSSVGSIAQCEANPDVVWAGMGETQFRGNVIPGDGVYRSTDAGKTWTHMGLASKTGQQMIARIRIDPANCERVFVAAFGDPFGPNEERGVYRTTNGGSSWERVFTAATRPAPSTSSSIRPTRRSSTPASGKPTATTGRCSRAARAAASPRAPTAAPPGPTSRRTPAFPRGCGARWA